MTIKTNVLKLIQTDIVPLKDTGLKNAKASFNVRRVDLSQAQFLQPKGKPRAGDLVLARISKLGQHKRIHMTNGRRARLYQDDLVILVYANRYAMDQFEAVVPRNLGTCNMVAAGGVASKMLSRNVSIKNATIIKPLGLLVDSNGDVMNTAHWALPKTEMPTNRQATVITVVGTEMNAGKTTTASSIIRSALQAGLRVGGAKITGTGAAGDFGEMTDAGAHYVYDLIDAGHPSTYKLPDEQVLSIFETLTAHLLQTDAEIIVLEIADGILQQETKALINNPVFKKYVDSIVLAASDAVAAKAGASIIEEIDLPLVAISGKVTGSEIGCKAAEEATGYPVFNQKDMCCPTTIPKLLPFLRFNETVQSSDVRL